MSDSLVFMFETMVLKVQQRSAETDNEQAMLAWLNGRIPAAKMLACAIEEGIAFTLMSKVKGEMLCEPDLMRDPQRLVRLVADGLKLLQTVDISDCPCSASRLENRLRAARYNVEHGLVDIDNTEPETWQEFHDPMVLLTWLEQNRPEEDLVLTHGDCCLPNIFTDGTKITGFIDLGKAGPADRWQDIALCMRSMKSNFSGRYTPGLRYDGYRDDMLADRLGIEINQTKLKYYILLDELF